jgi:hypothetical protein
MRRTTEEWAAATCRIMQEGPLAVSRAARLVPTSGKGRVSPSTLVRWIIIGKRGVHLDGSRLNGKTWWTSSQALERFWGELSAVEAGRRQDAAGAETVLQRNARAIAVDLELAELVGD